MCIRDSPDCDSFYIGESGRRLEERFKYQNGRDKNSHMLKHTMEPGHNRIVMDNVKIINKNFTNYHKRKVYIYIFSYTDDDRRIAVETSVLLFL